MDSSNKVGSERQSLHRQLERQRAHFENLMNEEKSRYSGRLEKMIQQNERELAKVDGAYKVEISRRAKAYEDELKRLQSNFEKAYLEETQKYEEAFNKMKENERDRMERLRNKQEQMIADLHARYQKTASNIPNQS